MIKWVFRLLLPRVPPLRVLHLGVACHTPPGILALQVRALSFSLSFGKRRYSLPLQAGEYLVGRIGLGGYVLEEGIGKEENQDDEQNVNG
jgi:hypothetical protein